MDEYDDDDDADYGDAVLPEVHETRSAHELSVYARTPLPEATEEWPGPQWGISAAPPLPVQIGSLASERRSACIAIDDWENPATFSTTETGGDFSIGTAKARSQSVPAQRTDITPDSAERARRTASRFEELRVEWD